MNKNPLGFNGNAVWALVILLIVGVAWIHQNAGFAAAAYTLAALGGIVCVLIGFMLALGAKQVHYSGMIGYKQAEASIEREKERARREEIKGDNRLEQRSMMVGTTLARQMFAMWKAQDEAQKPAQENNPFVIDLEQTSYQYNEDEL